MGGTDFEDVMKASLDMKGLHLAQQSESQDIVNMACSVEESSDKKSLCCTDMSKNSNFHLQDDGEVLADHSTVDEVPGTTMSFISLTEELSRCSTEVLGFLSQQILAQVVLKNN